MSPEAARNLWAEGDAGTSRVQLRALPDGPARPRRRRTPASSWGDLEWTPTREASPGGADGSSPPDAPRRASRRDASAPAGEPPLGERVDDPFDVQPLRQPGYGPEEPRPTPEEAAGDPVRRMRWEEPARERRTVRITGQPVPARRRPLPAATQISSRPDRVALWAVMLGLFLVLMAGATARAGSSNATLGERTIGKGDRGSDVMTLQRVLRMKGYGLSVDSVFGPITKRTVKRFQRRRGLQRDGRVGPVTTRALADTWRARTATIFGPGLYGNRTACGHTLAHRTRGLAHRELGCGRRVAVYHTGRVIVSRVIDRGPFTQGIAFDVTAGAARKLGMSTTSTIRAGY
jgi:hypothetical protein